MLLIKRPLITTIKKKTSLQTKANLRKSFEGVFSCCEFQVVFKF